MTHFAFLLSAKGTICQPEDALRQGDLLPSGADKTPRGCHPPSQGASDCHGEEMNTKSTYNTSLIVQYN